MTSSAEDIWTLNNEMIDFYEKRILFISLLTGVYNNLMTLFNYKHTLLNLNYNYYP